MEMFITFVVVHLVWHFIHGMYVKKTSKFIVDLQIEHNDLKDRFRELLATAQTATAICSQFNEDNQRIQQQLNVALNTNRTQEAHINLLRVMLNETHPANPPVLSHDVPVEHEVRLPATSSRRKIRI